MFQSHKVVMEHIIILYKKSQSSTDLNSPVDVIIGGLHDSNKLADTLSAITKLMESYVSCDILNQQNLLAEVKTSFESHLKQKDKVICDKSQYEWVEVLLCWRPALTPQYYVLYSLSLQLPQSTCLICVPATTFGRYCKSVWNSVHRGLTTPKLLLIIETVKLCSCCTHH